jgi:hypothetical protein
MPRPISPSEAAARIQRWAALGFPIAIVDGAVEAIEQDRTESRARAPRLGGALGKTIRVIKPRERTAQRTGFIRVSLKAGNKQVTYGSVHQTGRIGYPGQPKTRPHVIEPRGGRSYLSFEVGGRRVFAKRVNHPGSRFRAQNYLQVNQRRAAETIDRRLQASARKDLG